MPDRIDRLIGTARDRGHPPPINCHYGALSSVAKGQESMRAALTAKVVERCEHALISHATRPTGGIT